MYPEIGGKPISHAELNFFSSFFAAVHFEQPIRMT